MLNPVQRSLLVILIALLLPSAAYAQAAITGVVRDASGGVLPGVTVEAASPVLIEKVRQVVTDATGQYRIVDLRPGLYSVTFELPGFSVVRREGIELSGNFIATVNAELRVGAVEETITVTGETPIVDVQSARRQEIIDRDVISAIPSSRNAIGLQNLIPGMSATGGVGVIGNSNTDSGNIGGTMQSAAAAMHGGRAADSRIYADGINMGWAGGNGGGGNMPQVASAQEVVLTISGGLADAETGGVVVNVIPREGANTFSGQFNYSGSNDSLQGSNYTDRLKAKGLRSPAELISVYDVNPMFGGRIVADKLWFYSGFRQTGAKNTVPGMFWNKNAGDPTKWIVDFDRSQPAFTTRVERQATIRVTWQATPRNKFNMLWAEQYLDSNYGKGGGAETAGQLTTPEATPRSYYIPSRQPHVTWSSPISGRLLAEAGWGMYQARYRFGPRNDGTHDPQMIQVLEQGGEVPNLLSRAPAAPAQGGFAHSLIGNLASLRASLTYVTGAHNIKFGYQGGFGNPSQTYNYPNQVTQIRMRDGVPNQLTQTTVVGGHIKYVRNLIPVNFYAQDQWTFNRLTLQGGLRYDSLISNYPESRVGGSGYPYAPEEIVYPSRSTPGYRWKDISPRIGVAYDLFGNGKTAVRFNLGKYMEAITATNNDLDMNPLVRTVVRTTRGWTDTNRDYAPDCDLMNPAANGECARMDNQNLGRQVFNRSFDPDYVGGWGTRPYNWNVGLSVQHEVAPRVSVTAGFHRNSWGNWYVVDNRATSLEDYTPFSIQAPLDPRLPGGGGYTVSGLYNLVPTKVGLVDELAQSYRNFGEQEESWQGFQYSVVARLPWGLTVQGGAGTGRKLADGCAARAKLPEVGTGPTGAANSSVTANVLVTTQRGSLSVTNPYCRFVEPYRTDFRGLATYTIPRADVQVALTWMSVPGEYLEANFVADNAWIAAGPQPLGRPLTGAAVATVNLIQPYTIFADRRNNMDFRVAKIFRYGGTRTQVGVDIYNLMNVDVVTAYNQTFVPGGPWLTPTALQPARYARISMEVSF
ncbi:MAG TPA: carboxypeptidase regulatory-like domain-containing protein [Vicinamibacterales bacterium]|nr:carboxypeptidase regulatory-like domain-containing protein [Vicinamibacterales bacterium]